MGSTTALALRLALTALFTFSVTIVGPVIVTAQTTAVVNDESLKTPDAFPHFPPVEPADVGKSFVVQAGFKMELIAAEPLVTDPVAMAIDEDGRAFVVEMNDYPYTDASTHQPWQENTTDSPIGRIRLLEDIDGDGVFDRSVVFAEGLSWPSGILCYRGGVFVTATPDIWYLKDTDGDGRADIRDQVFTGFRKYNVQAVMNNPIWGLDNCIYVAGSSNGGSVLSSGQEQARPVAARGDFRIDPRSMSFELQAGGARFGNAIDDWGNRFLCNIRNPAIHVVLDNRYLARNPFFAAPSAVVNIAESGDQMPIFRISPVEPWRDLRGRQWSADPTKKVPRSELTGGGVFTSTSGINVYRGDAYPPEYRGQMFVAEVANNVIYRQQVEADGNTFRATRADENVEFVASTDTWFRPVNIFNAPDGTLYVLDMYREFIEHPWSIPDDIHARLDLTSGRDRGRIYRLAPPNFKAQPPPRLGKATSEQLVDNLKHEGSWWRETAQRLLVERQDQSVVGKLRELLRASESRPAVHALWTLVGLQAIEPNDVSVALKHPKARVREQAIRVAEDLWDNDRDLVSTAVSLASDEDSRVRLQLALSLGGRQEADVINALVKVATRDADDTWIRAALCSASPDNIPPIIQALLASETFLAQGSAPSLIEQLAQIIASSDNAQAAAEIYTALPTTEALGYLPESTRTTPSDAFWIGMGNGAFKKGKSLHEFFGPLNRSVLPDFLNVSRNVGRAKLLELYEFEASSHPRESRRIAATIQLTLAPFDLAAPRLAKLIDPLQSQAVQLTALRCLGTYKESHVAATLIPRLRSLTPIVREEALTVLMARSERSHQLLKAIERGDLSTSLLSLARRTQLLSSRDADVKELAESILGKVETERAAVIARYATATEQSGDATRGRQLFTQHCSACHRAGGTGVEIGPHMETVRTWDRNKILLNILDPNREVAPQSMAYSIALSSGNVISGMIAEETASSLTVKRAGVPTETILRDDIEQMSNTGQSLMPIGFEETISPEAMADLIAFLQSK